MITLHGARDLELLAVLKPLTCSISEQAGGAYDLTMTYPCLDDGIWQMLTEERCIKAPVPVQHTNGINLEAISYWRVKTEETTVPLWKSLPYSYQKKSQSNTIENNPSAFAWNAGREYDAGDYVSYNGAIYYCSEDNEGVHPPRYPWVYVKAISQATGGYDPDTGSTTVYVSGTKLMDLPGGTYFTKLSDFNAQYMRIRTAGGHEGYIEIAKCVYIGGKAEEDDEAGDIWQVKQGYGNGVFATPNVNGVKVDRDLASGEQYTIIYKYSDLWNYGLSPNNIEGYFYRPYGELYQKAVKPEPEPSTDPEDFDVAPRTIKDQYFRIYSTRIDSSLNYISIAAKHISYDLDGMRLNECRPTDASPTNAIAILQGTMLGDDDRLIVTDIKDVTVTADWSWASATNALLDPDNGLVSLLQAKLIRDNQDLFILKNDRPDTGFQIVYGVNLLGVTFEIDTEDIITRIYPVGQTAEGEALMLPEGYVDSALVENYAYVRMEVLDVDVKVGQEIETTDGKKITLTEEDCFERMREAAQAQFYDQYVDNARVTLDVDFLMLGDTEEYKQYKGLQTLNLYDTIRVAHPRLGIDTSAQVSAYEWDAIAQRYTHITLGDIWNYRSESIAGYEIGNRAITARSLSPGLKTKLGV